VARDRGGGRIWPKHVDSLQAGAVEGKPSSHAGSYIRIAKIAPQ
jgi:hypothetical protein